MFFNFDETPGFQDAINELKVSLKDKFSIDYVGIEILDRNNEYFLYKNDHDKWQEVCVESLLKNKDILSLFTEEYINMHSYDDNYYFNISKWKKYDLRAQIIGDRKNGLFINIYNEKYDYKLSFTITFKESNIDVENLDKSIVKEIIQKIENHTTMELLLKDFKDKIVKHRSVFYKYYEDAHILINNYSHVAKEHQHFLKNLKTEQRKD